MQYLVRLADRAFRDLEELYGSIGAEPPSKAFAWFNGLADAIYSLERFPERGSLTPETKKLRHLPFGNKPHIYRIIYAIDKRNHIVNVLHIRHGARAALSEK
jgi:plasmid stabilization system protein ParE